MNRKVATTLTEILHNPIVEASLDRSRPIRPVIERTLKAWEVDLERRRPSPAYTEGAEGEAIYRGTDFDLFTFLMALAKRRAVINIPSYANLQPRTSQLNQRIISRENRHGQIFKVISNNDVHSFSVRMKDFNVVEIMPDGREEVGAFRHFAVVDYFGRLHEGWKQVEFRATREERRFFEERRLLTYEEPLRFEHFVHPHLAMAFYGSRYIATKALAQRIRDQAAYYRKLASDLRRDGIRLPAPSEEQEVVTYESIETGTKVVVPSVQAKLILPEPRGEYPIYSLDDEGRTRRYDELPTDDTRAMQGVLRYADRIAKYLIYGIGATVRAPVRAVELAYFLHGFEKDYQLEVGRERTPAWGIPAWIRDYKESRRHRIQWNALKLTEEPDAFLVYRIHHKSIRVRGEEDLLAEPDVDYVPQAVVTQAVLV